MISLHLTRDNPADVSRNGSRLRKAGLGIVIGFTLKGIVTASLLIVAWLELGGH